MHFFGCPNSTGLPLSLYNSCTFALKSALPVAALEQALLSDAAQTAPLCPMKVPTQSPVSPCRSIGLPSLQAEIMKYLQKLLFHFSFCGLAHLLCCLRNLGLQLVECALSMLTAFAAPSLMELKLKLISDDLHRMMGKQR